MMREFRIRWEPLAEVWVIQGTRDRHPVCAGSADRWTATFYEEEINALYERDAPVSELLALNPMQPFDRLRALLQSSRDVLDLLSDYGAEDALQLAEEVLRAGHPEESAAAYALPQDRLLEKLNRLLARR